MTSYAIPPDIEDVQSLRLLRVSDVVKLTRLSSSQIYSMIQEGVLPAVRFGGAVRIRPKDLEEFMQENRTNQNPHSIFRP